MAAAARTRAAIGFLSCHSLHPERGYELNPACVTHAEDGPYYQRNRAYVGAGVPLPVRDDIGQSHARLLCGDKAQCGIKSMVGKRAGQGDMRGGIGHDRRAKARRISCGLINTACNRGGGQQGRFEIDSGVTSAGGLVRKPGSVNDRESAGKSSLQREGEVYIGGIVCVGHERRNIHAVGKILWIGTELQNKTRVASSWQPVDLSAAGAIVRRGVHSDGAIRTGISAYRVDPACQKNVRGCWCRAG